MKNVRPPKQVVVAVLTLATVIFWIVFGVLRIIIQPEIVDVPKEILEPLAPSLDTAVLTNLEGRIFLSDSEIGETQITTSVSPSALPTPEPTSNPNPAGSPLPTPTGSATGTPTATPTVTGTPL